MGIKFDNLPCFSNLSVFGKPCETNTHIKRLLGKFAPEGGEQITNQNKT